ncbi:DUF2306 domain-containing protein [Micromonospora sp. NPDC049175]|uniref:DUF2306 domain-containing protein n=1 Tax=Micromonospora sp. NPDC049175 TaxID=3364266 RepID=UPI003715F36C
MQKRMPWLMLAAAVVFSLVLVYPYLALDIQKSRIDVSGALRYGVLVTHIFTAAVALVLGPLQFSPKVRARPRIHRSIGRCYLAVGVVPSGLTAIPVAVWSGRLLTQVSLSTAAALWLITGGLGYRAARRRDFAAHRDWMMRNYALTFLAVTARIFVPLLLLVQIPFGRVAAGEIGTQAPSMIPLGQTLAWIVNLAVIEAVIRTRRRRKWKDRGQPDMQEVSRDVEQCRTDARVADGRARTRRGFGPSSGHPAGRLRG